jgi:hypothetical protein
MHHVRVEPHSRVSVSITLFHRELQAVITVELPLRLTPTWQVCTPWGSNQGCKVGM